MSIFRNRRDTEVDFSDESLLAASTEAESSIDGSQEQAAADSSEAVSGADALPDRAVPGAGTAAEAQAALSSAPSHTEQEQLWQQATQEAAQHWPQLLSEPRRLLAKMAEISARYGDSRLWQRSPAGIMREAAIELYGLPNRVDEGAISTAVRQAHDAGRRMAASRSQEKLGLAPARGKGPAPPALSEEQRIIRDMMSAAHGRVF